MTTDRLDPLIMRDGTAVHDSDDWSRRRLPELRALAQREIYGRLPEAVPVATSLAAEADDCCAGEVRYRGLRIELQLPSGAPVPIEVALFTPREDERPPVILAFNATGNPSLLDHPAIRSGPGEILNPHKGEQSFARGERAAPWPIAEICARGYALATFSVHDAQPDHHDHPGDLRPRLGTQDDEHWGALACWAWTGMRVLDALAQMPCVDVARAAVTGMSRRGKAALIAGAFDERFRLVIPHQSGTGGMALAREQPSETIERITSVFPHWFGPRYRGWAGREDETPIDQDLVIACCASRHVLGTAGDRDEWASPWLADEALRRAAPAWRLLGADDRVGIFRDALPPPPLPHLMQLWRDTEHLVDLGYWRAYLDAADAALG